jgi:hypothetical protein
VYAQLGQQPLARTTDAMRLKAALGLGAWASCDFSQVRAEAASTAAASAAEQQIELGQEDVRCEIGVRAAGVEPAALGHVHAQRDVEEQQRDGDGGATSSRNGSSVSSAGESRTAQLGISSSGGWTSR